MTDLAAHIKNVADFVEQLTKLLGFLAIPYLIAMGLSFKAGAKFGQKLGRRQRVKKSVPILTTIFETDKHKLFWKDETLIQGGLSGVVIVATYSTWVVLMLLFQMPSADRIPASVARFLAYPNTMVVFSVVLLALGTGRGVWRLWFLAGLSCAGAIATWKVIGLTYTITVLWIQALIFILQSLISAYFTGVGSGIKSADIEKIFPAVDLVMVDGETISDLRILDAKGSACRFVASDGLEWLVPHCQIRCVRAKARANDKKP